MLDFNQLGGNITSNDYTDFSNKPQINGVTLTGNKSTSDLGIVAEDIKITVDGESVALSTYIGSLVDRIASLETLIDAGNVTDRE